MLITPMHQGLHGWPASGPLNLPAMVCAVKVSPDNFVLVHNALVGMPYLVMSLERNQPSLPAGMRSVGMTSKHMDIAATFESRSTNPLPSESSDAWGSLLSGFKGVAVDALEKSPEGQAAQVSLLHWTYPCDDV